MIDLGAPIDEWMPTVWYGGFLPGLPDLCVGRKPRELAADTPWKVWVVETPKERSALMASLAKPVPVTGGAVDFRSGPDAAVRWPGRGDTVIALYVPPEAGWPWITLARWSRRVGREIGAQREVYTWDADMTESRALDRLARLRATAPAPIVTPDRGNAH